MLLAAIDIGTNAVRLFFANVFEQNSLIMAEKASMVRIPLRLGEDVFTQGIVSEDKMEKLVKTMNAFGLLIDVVEPEAYKAVATSAMREALNGELVVDHVRKQTGVDIEIIDGNKEANLVSAINNLKSARRYRKIMFVDIGGGSTEISLLENGKLKESSSFKIGTVRLLKEKVEVDEWKKLESWLQKNKPEEGEMLLVGSGGNVNKICKIYGRIPDNVLSEENLDYGLKHLGLFSLQQRVELMGLRPDRADVIVPAGEIMQFILKQTGLPGFYVPKIGLSDGIVTELYQEIISKKNPGDQG